MDYENDSPTSSSSSYDFLLELMTPLKRVVFECFISNCQPVQFIGKYNQMLEQRLLPEKPNPQAIIQAVLEMGCAKNECHPLLFPYLDALCECKYFDCKQYIVSLTTYRDFNKPQCLMSVIQKVGFLLKRVDCDFRDDKLVYEMCNTFVVALTWFIDLLSDIFSNRRENAVQIVKLLSNQVEFYSKDHFACFVSFCVACIDPIIFQRLYDQIQIAYEQMMEMSKNVYISKEIKEAVEQLPPIIKSLPTKPDFPVEFVKTYRFGTNQPRPAILSLVTIYSIFRIVSTNEEIANALMNIGTTLLMSKAQILVDLFRGIFLILLDYYESDENAAEQHQSLHTLILAEVFLYKRVTQIAELLVENGQCSVADLSEALSKLASNSVLMNALDRRQLDDTLASILNNSKIPGFLGNEQYSKIMDLRLLGMKKDADLFFLIYGNQGMDISQQERSRHWQFNKANEIARKIRENPDRIEKHMIELIDRTDLMHIDLVLACLCADGKIKSFSSKLASFVSKFEHSSSNEDLALRNQMFDSSFVLLMRIRQLFLDLRLEEITDGDLNSIFYKWTERVYEYLEQNHPMPVNDEIKQSTFISHFSRLKIGHTFWNGSWDYANLLNHMPAIGEALLDEIGPDLHKVDEEALKNILTTFGDLSCLFLCLSQWLETNKNSESLQLLSVSLRDVALKFIKQLEISEGGNKTHLINRWNFCVQLSNFNLSRLARRGPRTPDITYPYLVNYARRQVRPLDPHEIPDMQVLKDAFFYATQQGWASPNVIVCIDRLTKNIKQVEWIQCWFQQMVNKQTNADELEIAAELCISVAMTKPVICLLGIVKKIVDEKEFLNSSTSPISFNHTWILARMLVRSMLIVCWAQDMWQSKRKRFKKWQLSRKRKADEEHAHNEDLDTQHSPMEETADEDETVLQTLKTLFLLLQKETKLSFIRLRITFICFFMVELAMAPQSEYRQRLIEMIPDGMLFALCRLEPTCFNLPILLKIYDTSNPEHRQVCLQLACMLRKSQINST